MANRRVIDGQDSLTRIEGTWAEVVSMGQFPSVAEFARRARVGYSTFCHRYHDWAEKVRDRRDRKYGKRKKSSATLPRAKVMEMSQAIKQVTDLQRTVAAIRKELQEALDQSARLRSQSERVPTLEDENMRLRGSVDYLLERLQVAGVSQSELMRIWAKIDRHLRPIDGGGDSK